MRIWSLLLLAQWRESPLRLSLTVLAIALGVALGAAVYLVNTAAMSEFDAAARRLVGDADVIVRGSGAQFSDQLFARLARDERVAAASPMLELAVALPGRREPLKVLGMDVFRAEALQPQLVGDIGADVTRLFAADGILLSSAAAQELHLHRGAALEVIVGNAAKTLSVVGIMPAASYPQSLGLMDIASAQWTFGRIGRLDRIDLRLKPGVDAAWFSRSLTQLLPAGALAVAPQTERERAVNATRAYRVNLNMLALVALWTGAFLVFSTQALAVLRRRRPLALLRALGLTRRQLQWVLTGEGAALGAVGALIGIVLGAAIAAAVLRYLTGDLGNGQLRVVGASLGASWLPMSGFFAIGTAVAAAGAWLPARSAARQPPAQALKGGNGNYGATARRGAGAGLLLLAAGAILCRMPPLHGLPVFGYAAIAALLFGAVLLLPALTGRLLRLVPRTQHTAFDLAVAQLRENVALSTLGLASIIVSFSLMVAMAIMVFSFRESFDAWLGRLLPADLQIRETYGNDTAYWSAEEQRALAGIGGIAAAEFRRTQPLLLDAARAPVTLIARGRTAAQTRVQLPLVQQTAGPLPAGTEPAWISEAVQDLYGYAVGSRIDLPLGGRSVPFTVAGVWRDYARSSGSVVISRQAYIAATGDARVNEGSIWLAPGADAVAVAAAIRAHFPRGDSAEILTSIALKERSLRIFDRAFAITYALEAIAVMIGLAGVGFAAGSNALARRAEFGMLRHVGMLRRQILLMLAGEGTLTSLLGVAYGLILGLGLSVILVYVVNRQSFNWSIDLAVPAGELATLGTCLIGAAALIAVWSGRAAMSQDAVQAVREDW